MKRMTVPRLSFDHVRALTGAYGIYEHAELRAPRREHGYCTDDVARALSVVVREPAGGAVDDLTLLYLTFIERAVDAFGAVRNRMSDSGRWTDASTTDDRWGRAIAGLGSVVLHSSVPELRVRAYAAFLRASRSRSQDVRASAFAAIGAARVLRGHPDSVVAARNLLIDCLSVIPRGDTGVGGWPEQRLRYANGALCTALLVGGEALQDDGAIADGLRMLDVLLVLETAPGGHLSLVGTAGRGAADTGPLWDQQPIEAAAIAEACAHAFRLTGDERWSRGLAAAWGWFLGENDGGTMMYDPESGAGYDGLERGGRNENCGAESTLAALEVHQRMIAVEAGR